MQKILSLCLCISFASQFQLIAGGTCSNEKKCSSETPAHRIDSQQDHQLSCICGTRLPTFKTTFYKPFGLYQTSSCTITPCCKKALCKECARTIISSTGYAHYYHRGTYSKDGCSLGSCPFCGSTLYNNPRFVCSPITDILARNGISPEQQKTHADDLYKKHLSRQKRDGNQSEVPFASVACAEPAQNFQNPNIKIAARFLFWHHL